MDNVECEQTYQYVFVQLIGGETFSCSSSKLDDVAPLLANLPSANSTKEWRSNGKSLLPTRLRFKVLAKKITGAWWDELGIRWDGSQLTSNVIRCPTLASQPSVPVKVQNYKLSNLKKNTWTCVHMLQPSEYDKAYCIKDGNSCISLNESKEDTYYYFFSQGSCITVKSI